MFSKELDEFVSKYIREVEKEAVASGLEKAANIALYWRKMPDRNPAYKAACTDIWNSCMGAAQRIRKGEAEGTVSEVMQAHKETE